MGDAQLPGARRRRALRGSSAVAALTAAWAIGFAATPTSAQSPGVPPGGAPVQSVDELRRQVQERDAVIADLLRRVEALERASGQPAHAAVAAAPPAPGSPPPPAHVVAQA
ncbi:hypothetical protein, partial [Caulobacter sp. 17J65-9]|uniref:hypothetical protein n=1 Tax=Caulobacter sp. 17J65-9 TaxID=2709382 RepID=UPI0013C7CF18